MASIFQGPMQGPQPEPVPLTIRLLHDNANPPIVDPPPQDSQPSNEGGSNAKPKQKNDSFYKAWDKFMAASHKSVSSSSGLKPVTSAPDGEATSPVTRGSAAGIIAAATKSDTDSPARPDTANKGVGQKYVPCFQMHLR